VGGCFGSEPAECLKFSREVSEEAAQSILRVLRKMVPPTLRILTHCRRAGLLIKYPLVTGRFKRF